MRVTSISKLILALLCPLSLALGGTFSPCDINKDGATNIVDVQRLLNEVLGRTTATHDVNQDGQVNVLDVQMVVDASLNLGCPVGPQVTISDFNPKSGPIGTVVALTGSNFGSALIVSMPKQGGGTLAQPVTSATAAAATFVVAAGTATGAISVTNGAIAGSTAASFTVTPSSTFSLSASPASANVIVGQSIAVAVQLTSSGSANFTSLATMSVSGLPNGVTSSFKPKAITAGQISILTLQAPAGQAISTSTLTVGAAASVEGIAISQTTPVALSVVGPTTSFIGRTVVDDPTETPLAGVTVSTMGSDGSGGTTGCNGHTVVSDAAGNFALTNLPSSCIGPQMISFNGNTVTSPPGKYAGVNLVFTLVTGQVVVSPVLVHMPRADNLETYQVTQNANKDQTFVFKSIPGLSVIIYAGTTLTAADGSQPNPYPFSAVAIPIDRLPDQMPLTNSMVTPFIVSFPPDGTSTNQPVAVFYPNTLNTTPGTSVVLMTLDPTRGRMVAYGTGVISNDGSTIVPDFDPASGSLQHRFGISHFDWHGPAVNPPPSINPACGCPTSLPGNNPTAADPVDLSSGVQTWTVTDMVLQGNRGSLQVERTYRSGSTQQLAFGIGTGFNYDYRLSGPASGAATVNLQMPNGVSVPFTAQADGTLINTTTPEMAGAVMTVAEDTTATIRFKTGAYLAFTPRYGTPLLAAIGDPNGNAIQIQHDPVNPAGPIIEIDDPAGRKLVVTNDGTNITSITDPIGRTVSYSYTQNGYLSTVTDVLGGVTKYAYDALNRLTSVTDPRGVVQFQDTYDATGRVMSQGTPSGGTVTFVYTLSNTLVATSPVIQTVVTDARGFSTTYRFNTAGYVVSATDPIGQTRVFNRQPGTNLLLGFSGYGVCDMCGESEAGDVTYAYDGMGNMTVSTDALGNSWKYAYDPVFNQITSVTDPSGNVATLNYDTRGNLTQETDARGNSILYTRDGSGLITAIQDEAGGITNLTYDAQGDLISVSNQLGQIARYSYDGVSRRVGQMDPSGRTTLASYNAADQVLQVTDGNGNTLQYAYDIGGFLTGYTDSNGKTTSIGYDKAGRISSRTDPLGKADSYTYDLENNPVTYTNRRNQQAGIQYDALNRPIVQTYPDATVNIVYDTPGRISRVTDSQSGTFEMTYDLVGGLTKTVDPNGSISYTRDKSERVISRQVQGQPQANYSYDPNGNLLTAAMGAVSTTRTYDKRNLLVQDARSNGVTTSYSFDAAGKMMSLASKLGNNTLFSRAFTYDQIDHILGNSLDTGLPLSTPAATASYTAADRIAQFGNTTYTADEDGNRLTETNSSGATSYSWDSRGRLQSIQAPGGTQISFVYDPSGEMIEQHTTASGTDTLQRFIVDDAKNVAAIVQGESVTSVLDGVEMDDVVGYLQGSTPVLPLADQVASEGAFTDGSGAVIGREFYEPYGAATSSGTVGPFLYTGRPAVNGNLTYDRARFYDSTSGRFLSQDPIGLDGGKNVYAYGLGNPIGMSDPSGLDVWVEWGTLHQNGGIHQKICVGAPGAGRHSTCWEFASPTSSPFGSPGEVSKDEERSYRQVWGYYHQTTGRQDIQIKKALTQLEGQSPTYDLVSANCITFAHAIFNAVVKHNGLYTDIWRSTEQSKARHRAWLAAHQGGAGGQ